MSEAAYINTFTVVRVILVSGILAVIPLITRKGLLFGAYIGEERADGEAARRLLRRWYVGCLTLMLLSLAIGLGIGAAGWPLAGNLTATAFLLLAALVLYLRSHYSARSLIPPTAAEQADMAVAPIEVGEPKGATLARIAFGICLVAGLATVAYSTAHYAEIPDSMPIHFGIKGEPDKWVDKSPAALLLVPTANLVICPFIALFALLTARAKRSIRGGSGGRSLEAQASFRGGMANLLSGVALFTCALLTFLSVQMVRVGLGHVRSLGLGIWVIVGAMLLFLLGGLIRIMMKHGQGGALAEQGSVDAPLTNGLADNAHWYLGVFYFDREDPSILVEKRFGLGYTINFGNRNAVAIVAVFLLLLAGLAVLGLIGST
jgi:uncharacterized membrane protein